MMMMIGGVWHAMAGIAALVHDDIYVTTPEYLHSFDLNVWGWVQLLDPAPNGSAGRAIRSMRRRKCLVDFFT